MQLCIVSPAIFPQELWGSQKHVGLHSTAGNWNLTTASHLLIFCPLPWTRQPNLPNSPVSIPHGLQSLWPVHSMALIPLAPTHTRLPSDLPLLCHTRNIDWSKPGVPRCWRPWSPRPLQTLALDWHPPAGQWPAHSDLLTPGPWGPLKLEAVVSWLERSQPQCNHGYLADLWTCNNMSGSW